MEQTLSQNRQMLNCRVAINVSIASIIVKKKSSERKYRHQKRRRQTCGAS